MHQFPFLWTNKQKKKKNAGLKRKKNRTNMLKVEK